MKALASGDAEAEKTKCLELMSPGPGHVTFRCRSVPIDKTFLMPIEDIFSISGRGTVVTGRIEQGEVKVGEEVEIVGHPGDDEDGW